MKKNIIRVSLISIVIISAAVCCFLPLKVAALLLFGCFSAAGVFCLLALGAKAEADLRINDPGGATALDEYREHMAIYDTIIDATLR